jgi:predicted DCC family thiol-disulfide oxidoreductase YuxK
MTSNPIQDLIAEHPYIIFFDGVCNFCDSSVQFIIARDPSHKFRYASLQSDTGQTALRHYGLPEGEINSVLLIEHGQLHQESDAALRIARQLNGLWPMFYIFWWLPRFMRDGVYRLIARNRYRWFGQKESCRIPSPEERVLFLG